MEVPQVAGMQLRRLLGSGGCGRVYLAEDAAGGRFAVKVFDGMAIQRGLLARMTGRLSAGEWPPGVLPVVRADYDGRPAYQVTPWLADGDPGEDGVVVPRTLQSRLGEFPGEPAWPVVRALATALAAMHVRRVAHGNLKPGNVFFDETGDLLVADWTLGNMPGVARFEFTDALLYQPPEQLTETAGYAEEGGYRWDVFAFGVLAFRLLTGRFPRCDEIFSKVAPPPGESRVTGIQADLPMMAETLMANPEIAWLDEASDELEGGFREWIRRCLALESQARPATMREVAAGFEAVVLQVAAEHERERLLDHRRRADHRARRAFYTAGLLSATALALGGFWQSTYSQLHRERAERKTERASFRERTDTAVKARETADQQAAELKLALDDATAVAITRLAASRLVGDHLFAWAMAAGQRELPPLAGREQRLAQLERYFEDFLTTTAAVGELAAERSLVRLQLAEISLANGAAEAAARRLAEALTAWEGEPPNAEMQLRLAGDRLLVAVLWQDSGDPAAGGFGEARKALAEVPQAAAGSDPERLRQLTAILDFHEAKGRAAKGQDEQALAQLKSAITTLNHLADQRPDAVVLRSEVAACNLSAGAILEDIGKLAEARKARTLAATELTKLLLKTPTDFGLRLELAGCYGAMAESAVLAGDVKTAESHSQAALKLLEKLVSEQPGNREAVVRLAVQIGVDAGLLRDRGKAADANRAFDEGIRLLEGVRAAKPDDPTVRYRLALLWWQQGRMPGPSGKPAEEIRLLTDARALLAKLEVERNAGAPPLEQVQRALAYLLGDLGHMLQLAGKKAEAGSAFGEAIPYWDLLLKSRPTSEEYAEGRAWCRQRLQELE
jgi:serine/threonine protein kinase